MRVICLEESYKFERSAVSMLGEIVYLFPEGETRPSILSPEFPEAVLDRLERIGYDPQADFLLIVGPIVAVARAVGAICTIYADRAVKGIALDGVSQRYTFTTLTPEVVPS